MIFETSAQARYLVAMAIALGFGILFSAGVVLFLIPVGHLILESVRLKIADVWDHSTPHREYPVHGSEQ